ncbi:Pseudaminic acid cytidylyltransferase [Citrifermentans bremense]|uniref:Pseudaminic acid cytidylyltransferase n=1 Tax=Citrifermentans bremense TaxID=60035 RepID=A0A6S6M5D2_9BACT|nr:pseudaminic acid cytidylyltransferase [Citrifermentans bremense]BCG48883.1 Pseudaminic acid cytidylyltransferase [Citrifermentans bremense]
MSSGGQGSLKETPLKVAVIPARGGSKRIPHKNIKLFAGQPIIGYSIQAAKECGLFDRIIVSTDDEEIASVARSFGAEIPFLRPKTLADDFTGTNAVVKHAINWLADEGSSVDYACCIYATAPFLKSKYLIEGYQKLVAAKSSFAFSVTGFRFPIQRALRLDSSGSVDAMFPEHIYTRSQDLEEAYHDAGQFYWGKSEAFLRDEVMFSPASVAVVLPRHLVQDIDTPQDWYEAELMFRACQSERS